MLSIIVAIAENNVIGKDNNLIWHIPNDLKRFKEITSGHKMIMGRKTFESLPGVLPNRDHIIITRNKEFKVDSDRVSVIHDLNSFIKENENSNEEIFVIGGAEIYKELLPHCNKLYLTKVHKAFEGDTFFPKLNFNNYNVKETSDTYTDEKSGLEYTFTNLIKK